MWEQEAKSRIAYSFYKHTLNAYLTSVPLLGAGDNGDKCIHKSSSTMGCPLTMHQLGNHAGFLEEVIAGLTFAIFTI